MHLGVWGRFTRCETVLTHPVASHAWCRRRGGPVPTQGQRPQADWIPCCVRMCAPYDRSVVNLVQLERDGAAKVPNRTKKAPPRVTVTLRLSLLYLLLLLLLLDEVVVKHCKVQPVSRRHCNPGHGYHTHYYSRRRRRPMMHGEPISVWGRDRVEEIGSCA